MTENTLDRVNFAYYCKRLASLKKFFNLAKYIIKMRKGYYNTTYHIIICNQCANILLKHN